MNIREQIEEREKKILSPYAAFAANSLGRDREENKDDMRTDYARDRDRIIHCKAFRRLKHKTQVFLAPEGDHYRTRLTHTLEVSQIARSISRALNLNEDLTEAIALGHDLGHTPFGHAGERALDSVCTLHFKHNEQSVRVVELLENGGRGLNLTKEVRDGILNHKTSAAPKTLEGQVVRFSDKIAYINHDIDDGIRAKILSEDMIPKKYSDILGNTTKLRLDTLIKDVINTSLGKDRVEMSPEVFEAMKGLREYMFEALYKNPVAKGEEGKAEHMIKSLYAHYLNHPDELPDEYKYFLHELKEPIERVVCDYISGMSDQYSIEVFKNIYIPKAWELK